MDNCQIFHFHCNIYTHVHTYTQKYIKIYTYAQIVSSNPKILPSIFYCHYSVVKTQSSFEFQNSIIHPFHLNCSYFIVIVKILFLTHYLLEKHFKEGYIFNVFFPWKYVFPQSSRFQITKFEITFGDIILGINNISFDNSM